MNTELDEDTQPSYAEMRQQIPWEITLWGAFDFDATLDEFADHLEAYAADAPIQVQTQGGSPLTTSVADYFRWLETKYGDDRLELQLIQEDGFTGGAVRIALVASRLDQGGVHINIFCHAVYAHEAYNFYLVRDDMADILPTANNHRSVKRGRPHSLSKTERWLIVRQWREAKKQGKKKKKVFCEKLPLPNGEIGLPVRTLTRWEAEFPEL